MSNSLELRTEQYQGVRSHHPIGIQTPAWPTYEPADEVLQAPRPQRRERAAGDPLHHVGTHLDGPIHFCGHGQDIASLPLKDFLVGPGVVVDIRTSPRTTASIRPRTSRRAPTSARANPHHQHGYHGTAGTSPRPTRSATVKHPDPPESLPPGRSR